MTGSSHSLARSKSQSKKIPGYLHHKASGQARVRIDGHDHYLGPYGSTESRVAYGKLIAEVASGATVDPIKSAGAETGPTVNELVLVFMRHANRHYQKNGKPTDEIDCIKSAANPLVKLYGDTPAAEFGPLALKAVQQAMIDGKTMCRDYINKSISRIRRIFRHADANELIPANVYQRLKSLLPLQVGRSDAVDHAPREPVPQENIDKVKAKVKEQTRDILDLILLSAARPGEICMLTEEMIDRSGDIWTARLKDHKTVHHNKQRTLIFLSQAKAILEKYLTGNATRKLFKIKRSTVGNHVTAACDELKIKRFSPHWLRHNAASWLRENYGLDVAQIFLGHSSADMSQLYAHLNLKKAIQVARDAA